ncbi:hypothetical protein BD410DRAFT_787197 [Rickenella mellea]|uniref:Hydrophobin n=1 Tax=Rickenella mellea TaxID=50990 RepID=A0A4Y7Q6W8_9AGAM|nr:hypothetical protein BD410DRAFT_787197 [Rickenella mellea]
MLARTVVVLLTLLSVVAAIPDDSDPTSCSGGVLQCCSRLDSMDSPSGSSFMEYIGAETSDPSTKIGVGCEDVVLDDDGQAICNDNLVCCGDSFDGGVALPCTAVQSA